MELGDFAFLQKHAKSHFHEYIRNQTTRDGDLAVTALDLKPLCTFSQGSFHVLNENTCKVLA